VSDYASAKAFHEIDQSQLSVESFDPIAVIEDDHMGETSPIATQVIQIREGLRGQPRARMHNESWLTDTADLTLHFPDEPGYSNIRLPGMAAAPARELSPLVIARCPNARVLDAPRISLGKGDVIR
jgi:hypothetical protein